MSHNKRCLLCDGCDNLCDKRSHKIGLELPTLSITVDKLLKQMYKVLLILVQLHNGDILKTKIYWKCVLIATYGRLKTKLSHSHVLTLAQLNYDVIKLSQINKRIDF